MNYKVGMAVIKSTKTRVVVMVTNARRHPYIDFMKSSSDDYKVDVGMSLCISYHHHYPCFGAFYYCNPYFIIQLLILVYNILTYIVINLHSTNL